MSSTTLVTFLVQAPRGINTIQLLGSWDNFSKPYPMQKDVNIGSGHWRGCHSFTNIICDGESVQSADTARDGALKMGGRYWYYYQMDDDLEFHNPVEPSTTACPFLPGQEVNVLEVPIQVSGSPDDLRGRSNSTTSVWPFTLDPHDKYNVGKPPSDVGTTIQKPRHTQVKLRERQHMESQSIVDKHEASTTASLASRRSQTSPYPSLSATTGPVHHTKAMSRASTSHSTTTLRRIRRWRQVIPSLPILKSSKNDPLPAQTPLWYQPETLSDETAGLKTDLETIETLRHNQVAPYAREPASAGSGTTTHVNENIPAPTRAPPPPPLPVPTGQTTDTNTKPLLNGNAVSHVTRDTSWLLPADDEDQCHDGPGSFKEVSRSASGRDTSQSEGTILRQHEPGTSSLSGPVEGLGDNDLHYSNSIASSRTSGAFSSVVDSGTVYAGSRSSWRLSQPLTPTMTEFRSLSFEEALSHLDSSGQDDFDISSSGFHGYSLPEAEHASALTITNLETATSISSKGEEGVPFEPKHRQQIIDAWNDGAEQHQSSMQDLVDDLGYLGKLIA